jgi:hypothetical protein
MTIGEILGIVGLVLSVCLLIFMIVLYNMVSKTQTNLTSVENTLKNNYQTADEGLKSYINKLKKEYQSSDAVLRKNITNLGTNLKNDYTAKDNALTRGYQAADASITRGYQAADASLTRGYQSADAALTRGYQAADAALKKNITDGDALVTAKTNTLANQIVMGLYDNYTARDDLILNSMNNMGVQLRSGYESGDNALRSEIAALRPAA